MLPTRATIRSEMNEDPLIYRWSYLLGPWALIALAWGIIIVAFLTKQTYLIDHDFLLRTSHFPWWLALVAFLVAWQLMILAMMLPSTLSMLVTLAAMDRTSRPVWHRDEQSAIYGFTNRGHGRRERDTWWSTPKTYHRNGILVVRRTVDCVVIDRYFTLREVRAWLEPWVMPCCSAIGGLGPHNPHLFRFSSYLMR